MKKTGIFLIGILFCILFIRFASASNQGVLDINILGGGDCSINFNKGWSFFSFCKNLDDNNASVVFSSIENKYRYLMKWNPVKQEFDIFSPKSSVNPIPDLNDNEGYFIYLYNPDNLMVKGSSSNGELRNLVTGWNSPGYQLSFSTPIDSLTASINDDYRYIMKWDSFRQEFEIYSQRSTRNPFSEINETESFFIYSLKSISLTT